MNHEPKIQNHSGLGLSEPRSDRGESKGFTLVELLVVISILAILAVVGVTVFAGAQGQARDGQRRSEITSIAKSIETTKDYVTGIYTYKYAYDALKDFPKGLPKDPQNIGDISTLPKYCGAVSTSQTPPAVDALVWGSTSDCPTSPADWGRSLTLLIIDADNPAINDFADGTVKSWAICARLERSSTPFCVTSLTRAP